MLPVHLIRQLLQDRNARKVATATGLHENTVRAIRSGENVNPTASTIKALSDYLEPTK